MTDTGHWEFPHDFEVSDWHGFIYRIIELDTGKEYVGKKVFWRRNRVKVKGRKNRKVVFKESDWKTYTGSSSNLNEAIKQKGMDNYRFQIESLHKTKASMSYAEVRKQILEDVLRAKLPNGDKKYYNGQIGSVKYIPPEETEEESKMRIDTFLVEHRSK